MIIHNEWYYLLLVYLILHGYSRHILLLLVSRMHSTTRLFIRFLILLGSCCSWWYKCVWSHVIFFSLLTFLLLVIYPRYKNITLVPDYQKLVMQIRIRYFHLFIPLYTLFEYNMKSYYSICYNKYLI